MRQFINQLKPGETVNEVYRVNEKFLRSNKQGNLYIQLLLSDRTGTIDTRIWNATEDIFDQITAGDYIAVEGLTQKFQNHFQMVLRHFEKIDKEKVEPSDFLHVAAAVLDISVMVTRIREMLRTMKSADLVNLADCYLADHDFMERFCASPAGIRLHHAYRGGLLEHTLTMMEMAMRIAPLYSSALNADMLLIATFLHDTGKIEELSGKDAFTYAYTDSGQMLGHSVLGVQLLDKKIVEVEKLTGESFDEKTALLLRHVILSHHGELQNGSTKLPTTLEGVALHFLDSLDAKVVEFQRYMIEDPCGGSSWTNYIPSIDRKLFKG